MSEAELQAEEIEVLQSIYDGDICFKEISPKIFQYKYGENESLKSFVLEIKWTEKYPEELPEINLDAFYNKHLPLCLKEQVVGMIKDEAQQYIGMSMTYSLFEFVKEKFDDIIKGIEEIPVESIHNLQISDELSNQESSKKLDKKEQLTKAQKRRQWNKLDAKGEKQRGWNWVDIVKHLSQTGSKEDQTS